MIKFVNAGYVNNLNGCFILSKNEYLMRPGMIKFVRARMHARAHREREREREYEQEAITVLRNQAAHTDREVTAQRPDIIIKNKRENMHTDRCGNRQKRHAKGRGKEAKLQDFMYRDTTNMEPEM